MGDILAVLIMFTSWEFEKNGDTRAIYQCLSHFEAFLNFYEYTAQPVNYHRFICVWHW